MEQDEGRNRSFGARIAGGLKAGGMLIGGLLVLGAGKILIPALIGGVAGAAAQTVVNQSVGSSGQATKQQLMDFVLDHETFGPTFRAMQKFYPAEFDDLLANSMSAEDPNAYVFETMKRFRIEKGADLAQAPAEKILAVLYGEKRVIEWLAERSPKACAGMAFGTAESAAVMPAGAVEQFASYMPAVMEALGAGKTNPVGRDLSSGAEALYELYATNLAETDLTDEQYFALLDGSIMQMSVEDQCKVGVANYEAIANLPAEEAANFYAMLSMDGAGSV